MKSKVSLERPESAAALRTTALAALAVSLSACVAQVGVEGSDVGYDESGYVAVQAREAPPPLPDYEQPPCPEDGYLWTPGYWGWSGAGYYWVPGTWVQPPRMGVLWTPGYWAFAGGAYAFHAGYWSPHVGYYGGINYGFGYPGRGFEGGGWHGNRYSYNRGVSNGRGNRASYTGGAGGIAAAPSGQDRQFWRESHVAPTPMQQQHSRQAAQDPALFARANGGHPGIARPQPQAESQPQFRGRGLSPGQPSNQLQPRSQIQQPNQLHAPNQVQRPAQNHEPKHERDGDREKPHPKKRADNDPSGR